MRTLFLMLAGIGSLGLVASGATAGTLAQADLSVWFGGGTATFTRTSADGLSGSSTASTATFDAGSAFAGLTATVPHSTPKAVVTKASFALGANGLVQVTGGGVSVTAPLAVSAAFANASSAFLTVPLAIGAGTPASPHVVTANHHFWFGATQFMTLSGTGWHLGAVTATGLTSESSPIPDVSAHGSFDLTPNGGGTVKLVTLTRVTTTGLTPQHSAGVTTLTLTYLPEPGSVLLLGLGAVGLVAAGRRRRRAS